MRQLSNYTLPLLALSLLLSASCGTTREAQFDDVKVSDAPKSAETVDLEAAGDAAWLERSNQEKLTTAIKNWKAAAEASPSAEVLVKLAHAYYLLGDNFFPGKDPEQKAMRNKYYTEGLATAEKAIALAAPDYVAAIKAGATQEEAVKKVTKEAVGAVYWYSSNMGKWARSEGTVTILRYKDDVKTTMARVRELDQTYFFGGPERYFGALEAATQGMLGGSFERSVEAFEKSIELAPNYLGTKVLYADFYAQKKNDRALFEKLLKEVIAADPAANPECEQENILEQQKAKRLLSQIDDLF